jgi:hypothetical protein
MGNQMARTRSSTPTPESVARANRQRVAYEEGLKAMADIEQRSAAVRANMARLRALREAEETKTREAEPVGAPAPKAKRKKKVPKAV